MKPKVVDYHGDHVDDPSDSDGPCNSSKTPTRLPPFSPHFARGLPVSGKDDEGGEDVEDNGRLHPPMDREDEHDHGHPPHPSHVPIPHSHPHSHLHSHPKDLSRADSLPDLSGRLGDDPCSPPPSPMGKSLP